MNISWMKYGLLFLIFILISCKNEKSNKIRVAAAANLQFAITEIVDQFEEQSHIECELITTSSGKLTAQIMSGAPYDIFVSADLKYPQQLHSAGFTEGPPKVYAQGHLVLWSKKKRNDLSLEVLMHEEVDHIAVANPETAPYGKAAFEVLSTMNGFQSLKAKLVYGESISQTNQFIYSEAADLGFTSISTVLGDKTKELGSWIAIDTSYYSPIKQGVVILQKENRNLERSRKFEEFLFTKKAQEIFKKFGYST